MKAKHNKRLDEAAEIARKNPIKKLPKMAAVIYSGSNMIGSGINSYRTHTMMQRFSKNNKAMHLHAEIHAIVNAIRQHGVETLEGSSLYVARAYRKHGNIGLAKPCAGCQAAVEAFGIKDVYWTSSEEAPLVL